MSGYGESDIVYDERAEKIITVASLLNKILNRCRNLLKKAENFEQEIKKTITSTVEANVQKQNILIALSNLKEVIRRDKNSLDSLKVPSKATDLEIKDLDNLISHIKSIDKDNEKKSSSLKLFITNFVSLTEVDDKAVEIRAKIREVFDNFRENSDLLQHWKPNEYEAIKDEIDNKLKRFRYNLNILTSENIANIKSQINQVNDQIMQIQGKIEKAKASCNLLEEEHNKRLYVLQAITGVCKELGFKEIGNAYYENNNEPNGKIIKEFDTLDHGKLIFKLNLYCEIETDSKILRDHCSRDLGSLSKLLVEKYGIQASFPGVGSEQPKNLIYNRAKKEPRSLDARN